MMTHGVKYPAWMTAEQGEAWGRGVTGADEAAAVAAASWLSTSNPFSGAPGTGVYDE